MQFPNSQAQLIFLFLFLSNLNFAAVIAPHPITVRSTTATTATTNCLPIYLPTGQATDKEKSEIHITQKIRIHTIGHIGKTLAAKCLLK
jgi:hypothetical protein